MKQKIKNTVFNVSVVAAMILITLVMGKLGAALGVHG